MIYIDHTDSSGTYSDEYILKLIKHETTNPMGELGLLETVTIINRPKRWVRVPDDLSYVFCRTIQ